MGNPFGIEDDDPIYQAELQRLMGQQSGNKPGFASAFKNALGSQVQGIGQLASDFGWKDNPIESYGKGVQARNPMDINSLSDIWERPGDAIAQGTGMALGYIVPSLVGRGANLAGKLLAAPRVAAAGAALNTMPVQAGLAALPSYGGIREQQEQEGNDSLTDKMLAGVGAAAVGGIEMGFGPQRMLGIGRGAVDKVPSKAEFVAGLGKTPLKTAVKQGARVVGEEMGEELVQNPIEQLSAYQDPRTAENINQTLTGAALAGMGTLGFGAAGGAHAGLQHNRLKGQVARDLLNPGAVPLGDLRESAEWNKEFLAKDEGQQPADEWYNDFMLGQFSDRNQQIYQSGLDETKARLYGSVNPDTPLLPAPVIPAEGGEHQVSLERLDVLQGRRDATAAAEEANTLLSDSKAEVPSEDGFDFNNQNVPVPTDLGSAIGTLVAVGKSRQANQPIVNGSPLHEAMLGADRIIRDAGMDPAKVFADVSLQLGGRSGQQTKSRSAQQTNAAVGSSAKEQRVPSTKKARGQQANEFEAELASAIASGNIAESDDIVAAWNESRKTAGDAKMFKAHLADKLSGPAVEQLTPEQRLQQGYVKKTTYTAGEDGRQIEHVTWVKETPKQKRETQSAVAAGEQIDPDNIDDETHAEGVRMFQAGDSLRQISEALGGSHETWRKTLLNYGYATKAREDEAAAEATATSSATEETPEELVAAQESPDDSDGDYTNNDERFDASANNEGRRISNKMNSGGVTAATTDKVAARQIKAAVSSIKKAYPSVASRVVSQLAKLNRPFARLNPQQQLMALQTAKEGGRDLNEADVAELDKLADALKTKQDESKLAAARAFEEKASALAEESRTVEDAAKSVLQGNPDAVVSLLTALNGENSLRLMQVLRSEFGMPRSVVTPKAAAEFFVELAKQRAEEEAVEDARVKKLLPDAEALWNSAGGYGPEFDALTPEAQLDFARVALDFSDSPQVLKHLKGQFSEQTRTVDAERSESPAGVASRGAAGSAEGIQGSQAAAGGGTNSLPRVEIKKRRVAARPETAAQAEGVTPTASFSRKESVTPSVSYYTATPAEKEFFRSGDFGAYLRDFMLDSGLNWNMRPDVSVFEGRIVVPAQDTRTMQQFAEWLMDAPDNRGSIPPQMRDGTFSKALAEARAEQESSTTVDRLFRRSQDVQELTFSDGAGNRYKESVVTFPYASFPEVKSVVLSRARGMLANVFDKVEGFYLYDGSGDFAYRNPDGSYKIVLSRETAESDAEYISQVIDHELAHVADNADHNPGSKQNFSATPVMGVMVARAKAMWEKLPMNENGLWGHLYYPFNSRYDESRNPKSLRMEVFAQLISAYQNPKLSAELKAASPALYQFAEDMHNEIASKDFSTASGINPAKPIGKAQGNAAVYSRSGQEGKEAGVADKAKQVAENLAGKTGALVAEDTAGVVKKMVTSMAFLHDLVDEVTTKLPSAKDWYKAVQNSISARRSLEQDAEKIATKAGALSAEGLKRVNDFIAASTFEQKWGYDATFKKETGDKVVKADAKMAAKFRELTPEEQRIVKEVFAHGEMMADKKFALLKKLGIDGEFSHVGKLVGPYAPLKRFGSYIGMLKSKELRAAEDEYSKNPTSENQKRVAELKQSGDNYVIRFFDTRGQAKQFAKDNASKWFFTDSFEKSERAKQEVGLKETTLEKVMSAVRMNDSVPDTARKAMLDMVRDMYFSSLDEHNARLSGVKRKNMAGFDEDMIRSFLSHSRAEAGFLANMEFGGEINDQFYKMQQDAKDETGHRVAQDEFNALAAHYAENLNYKETPVQDRVMALTSAWQLATSIGYHLTNFSQGVMVTIPKLAADFNNYQGAWSSLMDGYKTLWATGWKPMQAFDPAAIKNRGLRAALEFAANMGVLDVGMDEDLTQFEATRSGHASVDKASGAARTAIHKLRQVSRSVETANRVSSAVAAYNMMFAKTGSTEKAQEYAVKILQTTQGEFSRTGAPLLLKKLPKFVTQYRKYQFMMAALYAKAFRDAFFSADPEVKAIGKRMLAYKMFHTSVAAGLLGLPLMNLVGLVFSMAGGDDDEPADLERSLRKWIGDEDLANLLLHGPLNMLGLDMSSKLGDDKIFSISPYSDFKLSSKQDVANTVLGLAGPAASQAGKFAEGFGFFGRGDYYKGVEQFMPKGVSDAMRAFRLANEGFTLKNGDLMVKPEDINGFSVVLDGLGVNSAEIKQLNWLRGQQYELQQFYKDRSKKLQHEYVSAYKDKDTVGMSELRDEWNQLQAGKDKVRYLFNNVPADLKKQPMSSLIRSPFNTEKRERKLQTSVPDDF